MIKFVLIMMFFPFVVSGQSKSSLIYDTEGIAEIYISVDAAKLDSMLNITLHTDDYYAAAVRFKNAAIDSVVDSVGLRVRGNTSRDAQKKSFKLSFNTFVKGRKFYGIDKLNLNGEHNDPSIARSKICWEIFNGTGAISSRCAYAKLYINGEYKGLYANVEHIDDKFLKRNFTDDSGNLWKCLYPADLHYINSNPESYKVLSGDRQIYELETNEEDDDYSQLARFISILNIPGLTEFQDSLEKAADLPSIIKNLAFSVLAGHWDDYWSNQNNYYLYHEPSTDKMYFIPYDLDNTLGIDWFDYSWDNSDPYDFHKINNGPRPLAEKIMSVGKYRDLYTHYLRFYLDNVFNLQELSPFIDSLKTLISDAASDDIYRTLDYGFTYSDFLESFSETGYSNLHAKRGIKEYIKNRTANLPGKLVYEGSAPLVYKYNWQPEKPGPNDTIYFECSVFAANGVSSANIAMLNDGSDSPDFYPMKYDPVPGTKIPELADRWTGKIPPLGNNADAAAKFVVEDSTGKSSQYPGSETINLKTPAQITQSVLINEFLAENDSSTMHNEEFPDWIELYNSGNEQILLTGKYLTDDFSYKTKWEFTEPDLYIGPKDFLLIWCDDSPVENEIHTNFKLSKDGEQIALIDSDGISYLDSVTFGKQKSDISFGRSPDGSETWQFGIPSPGVANQVTDIKNNLQIPLEFTVKVYPNPFNPVTNISYSLDEKSDVKLRIFDILGRNIYNRYIENQNSGNHLVKWNPASSGAVSSGVYYLQISTVKSTIVKKLMFLK